MSAALITAKTLVLLIKRLEKCWGEAHQHEPFICTTCRGVFCRYAETDGADEGLCLECWEGPDDEGEDGT